MNRTYLAALAVATVLAGAVAAIGMLASLHTVSTQMRPSFKGWAWTVPVTLDASIASFSILELVLLRIALPHLLARVAVYAATAATVYLNIRGTAAGEHDQLIAHAAMPCVWALYIELLRGAAAALTRRERHHPEHPILAFLLAPRTVPAAWRRGILAQTAPSQARQPKMSAARGHFLPPSDLPERGAVRDRTDIFPAPLQDQTEGPSKVSTAHALLAAADLPVRIGRGRGLTGRHAVLDLARRHPELTGAQIAERLNLTPRTVRRHLGRR
jgi:DNA-binding CsgD family transcriptional regulator